MQHCSPVVVGLVLGLALGSPQISAAQPASSPIIHRVTVQPDSGVLTITGTGLGPDLLVTVDGQAVTTLPGASDTLMEVLAPTTVLSEPGSYRLTVVDPVRQVGDGFVVASPPRGLVASGADRGEPRPPEATQTAIRTPAASPVPQMRGGPSPLVIEDQSDPFTTALGFDALAANTTGYGNAAIGAYALSFNTEGNYNTASGHGALNENTTGESNTAGGAYALLRNTTGSRNTASGFHALASNTTGEGNTAGGFHALFRNITGTLNTASGEWALYANTTGTENTASGSYALRSNTTGQVNTASGSNALLANTTGEGNAAFGYGALVTNTTGHFNTASGRGALALNTTGSSNTAVGDSAGLWQTTGSYNISVGADVAGIATDTNTIRIGLPYDSGTGMGQNQTFIAGIRGTAVTGGEMVFIDAAGKLGSGAVSIGANSVGSPEVIDDALTASDLAPDAVGTSELAADAVTAAKVAFNYAASTSEGGPAIDVACVGCVDASEVGFSFASLGPNTFTATQAIGAGNLDLVPSTATAGNLTKNGLPFLHDVGTENVFLGANAGNFTLTGAANTATGAYALNANTTGSYNTAGGARSLVNNTTGVLNTASGFQALRFNTTGSGNTATGGEALDSNTSGEANTATGVQALQSNTTGIFNTASGHGALGLNSTGSSNTAVGHRAGHWVGGSYNITLGADVVGTAPDTNTIRLGLPFDIGTGAGQNRTFIAGIHGTQLTGGYLQVVVDANGQLGTLTPPVQLSGSATGTPLSVLQQQVQAQQAIIAALLSRLERLEAASRGARRR